ncbi:MAG: glycoside hydrolase family 13 protein, partial [Clostridia bacterium]|nr:glycoside hydrolase family 13 protein [Clostridia bacterium]
STLIKEAHKRNIKIILDGVFNHTGSDSRYFNKKGRFNEVGAYESTLSPYYNWYNFYEHPEKYESWWGIDILPRLNHSYQNCRLYFARDIAKMWLEKGADGWRLDVADELSDEFLEELCKNVKAFPDKAIVGEVWENAVTKIAYGKRREYFEGKQLDSVMNYPFKEAVIRLLRNGDILFFYNTLTEIYSSYPKEVSDALWNILSTHDTKRILTSLAGEEEAEKTNDEISLLRLSKEEYERGKELLKIAAVIQYTVFGSPLLYYGDEAGMEGYGDPFCRLPFPWGKEDEELLDFYRELGAFRRSHPALKDGSFKFTHIDESFLEYERVKGEDKVRVRITIKR